MFFVNILVYGLSTLLQTVVSSNCDSDFKNPEAQELLKDRAMKILLEPSQITPYVKIDSEKGIVVLKGQSSLERAILFYHPLIKRIYEAFANSDKKIRVDLSFRYFNTSSSKCFLDFFRMLKKLENGGCKLDITWHYEKNDAEMKETGEDYADLVEMEFQYNEIIGLKGHFLRKAV